MAYVYFEREDNVINVEEVKTKKEFDNIFGNDVLSVKPLKMKIKELVKIERTELDKVSLDKIRKLEKESNGTYLHNPKMDILEEIAIIDFLFDMVFNPFHNQEDSGHKLLKTLNIDNKEINNKKENKMTYTYFIKGINGGELKKVETMFEVTKRLGINLPAVRALSGTIRELMNLNIKDSSIDFEDTLEKINELEEELSTLFVHNPKLTIVEEIGYIYKTHNAIFNIKSENVAEDVIRVINLNNLDANAKDDWLVLDNDDDKIKFTFREITEEEADDLCNKEYKNLYVFTRSARPPYTIKLRKMTQGLMEKFQCLTENKMHSVKYWLSILPFGNTSDSMKALNKLEHYLDGELVGNPLLKLDDELMFIEAYNNKIGELLELTSEDKKFRNRLINLLLED